MTQPFLFLRETWQFSWADIVKSQHKFVPSWVLHRGFSPGTCSAVSAYRRPVHVNQSQTMWPKQSNKLFPSEINCSSLITQQMLQTTLHATILKWHEPRPHLVVSVDRLGTVLCAEDAQVGARRLARLHAILTDEAARLCKTTIGLSFKLLLVAMWLRLLK